MKKHVHLIGNGPSAGLYNKKGVKGAKYTCNLPPFNVPGANTTFMVDFKMMRAIHSGSVKVPGDWIVGHRPKIYMQNNPDFRMRYASHIKEIFTEKPDYVENYRDFNCGHMAAYYILTRKNPTNLHLYGFDSLFDFEIRSCTDFYLISNREEDNTHRLTNVWREVWEKMFNEFNDVHFTIYHKHDKIKINKPDNVEIIVGRNK